MTSWQKLLLIITFSSGITVPLTNDLFVAGIPAMQQVFISHNITLVLSMSLLGLAIAQPIYGPLSDHFGRKPVLIVGLLIYTLASAVVMLTHSFHTLLIARIIQAIGVCSTITSALAIARDTYEGHELTRAMSFLAALMAVGPVTAPLLGSFLNTWFDWHASFECLFYLGIFYSIFVICFYQETHPLINRKPLSIKHTWHVYQSLVKQVAFLNFCVTAGFTYGVLFSFIAMASIFIIDVLHLSILTYGIVMAINGIIIMIASIFVPKLCKKISHATASNIGLILIALGGILMFIANTSFINSLYTFMLPMFICTLGIGFIRPAASTGAMSLAEKSSAGTAASFFNFFSFVLSVIAMTFCSHIIHSISYLGIFFAALSISALVLTKLIYYFLNKPSFHVKKYEITRQLLDGSEILFELENIKDKTKILKKSHEIYKDKILLKSLSHDNIYLIGFVHGSESTHLPCRH